MTYFAGLDVSLEETSICVVDEAGRIVKELRTASEPEAVATAGARKIRSSSGHRGEQRRLKRYRPTHAVCQIKYQLVHLTKRLLDITRKERSV